MILPKSKALVNGEVDDGRQGWIDADRTCGWVELLSGRSFASVDKGAHTRSCFECGRVELPSCTPQG